MSAPLRIRQLHILPLQIEMRFRFEHAQAARTTADPIVVRLAAGAPYAHIAGYGETLARPYVTGETRESVLEDLAAVFAPRLAEFAPATLADALEFIDALPVVDASARVVNAARAAVELALIDLVGKVFRRRASDIAGWMGLPGFGDPGSLQAARYSGIVVGRSPAKLAWGLRLQRCFGLRDFKIKVAVEGWQERLRRTYRVLRGALRRGVTLRADANGGWDYEHACDALPLLERFGVCALEQPLREADDTLLPDLASRTSCALIVDESLLTLEDGRRLADGMGVRVFNIRIAKNGGLMPSLRLARLALSAGLDVQLGCLVGETSILSAAGVAFLTACPRVRFVEGAFGRLLLRHDVAHHALQFRWRGRPPRTCGFGLGVAVDDDALEALTGDERQTIAL
ncbi:MAG: N-succinyl-L-Arg/Lys racemase [Phycisphaerae bacterium]|nr:N-succinyl-L-Arg/Lys racemase [Phycisphaerae bacterium]